MKLRSTIGCYVLLFLYMGVLLHNAVPHVHTEGEVDHEAAHPHHHHHSAHAHQESSEENSTEDPHFLLDLALLLTHFNPGVNHFNDFVGAGFSYFPLVLVAVLLFRNLWNLFHKILKPPEDEPDKRLQILCLSATSRRGPPSFS